MALDDNLETYSGFDEGTYMYVGIWSSVPRMTIKNILKALMMKLQCMYMGLHA
jgi:hypothetical protein